MSDRYRGEYEDDEYEENEDSHHFRDVMSRRRERESRKPKIGISKKKGRWIMIIAFIALMVLIYGVKGQRFDDIINAFNSFRGG